MSLGHLCQYNHIDMHFLRCPLPDLRKLNKLHFLCKRLLPLPQLLLLELPGHQCCLLLLPGTVPILPVRVLQLPFHSLLVCFLLLLFLHVQPHHLCLHHQLHLPLLCEWNSVRVLHFSLPHLRYHFRLLRNLSQQPDRLQGRLYFLLPSRIRQQFRNMLAMQHILHILLKHHPVPDMPALLLPLQRPVCAGLFGVSRPTSDNRQLLHQLQGGTLLPVLPIFSGNRIRLFHLRTSLCGI